MRISIANYEIEYGGGSDRIIQEGYFKIIEYGLKYEDEIRFYDFIFNFNREYNWDESWSIRERLLADWYFNKTGLII